MGHWIELDTPTGGISAWHAEPAVPPRGALVIIQEIFGVNAHIRTVVDKFAAHGYSAIGFPAVSYYGGRTVPLLHEKPHAPLLLHFGEDDPIIPPADVKQHHEALPGAEIDIWPAGHGFNCDQRADYNATVAVQALQRTLAFLANNLA